MAQFADGQIAYHVLMLIGSAGPVAIYFLSLGLMNCSARPCLVSARSDFIALSVVLAPLLLWSLPVAIQFGSGWMLGLAAIVLAILFRKLVPGRSDGFVIYNVSRGCGTGLIDAIVTHDEAGFRRSDEDEWTSADGSIRISINAFVLLRSISIQFAGCPSQGTHESCERIRAQLERRLKHVEQLPSIVGAGLVFAGVGIAVVPMWLVTRHIQDLVDAVASFFG